MGRAQFSGKYIWGLAILGAINFIVSAFYALSLYDEKREHEAAVVRQDRAKIKRFAYAIEQKLPPVMDIAKQIAEDLSQGRLDSTALLARLGEDVAKFDYIDGLFVAFEKFKFDENREYFAPLYLKSGDRHELVFLDYDYTENDWF